ncbi:hypothetical protein QBC44DRAFT_355548 [Cladorrhinum sp. PSN332]|nr:hypothetical protein QBC44DRAFT_355548 [Cladorrhinum sp. PSN332]
MAPTHKQIFWDVGAGAGDIGPTKRAQIAKAALMLQQSPVVLHSSSAGGYNESEAPEIALVVDVEFAEIQNLTNEVETALANEGLPGALITLKANVWWLTLNEVHLKDLDVVTAIQDMSLARAAIDDLTRINTHVPNPESDQISTSVAAELATILSQLSNEDVIPATAETDASNISAKDLAEAMLLTEEKYKRMRDAKNLEIEHEINGLKDALVEVSKTSSTNSSVIMMILGGLASIGGVMIKAYQAYQAAGGLSAMISAAIAGAGGIGAVAATAAAIAAVILAFFLVLKDAVNALVVVNGSEHKINFTKDAIINGERFKVTLKVPAAQKDSNKPFVYGCGFYTYRKWRIGGQPIGTFGSLAGVALRASNGTEFSVGADCPNTVFGGTNCFRLRQGSDAKAVAELAGDSSYSFEAFEADGHRCSVRRSYTTGSINFGICCFERL